MRIALKKFGEILISRPAGREAFLVTKAYLKPQTPHEPIELDFTGVKVLAPSWLDEFMTALKDEFGTRIICLPSKNASVIESLKAIDFC